MEFNHRDFRKDKAKAVKMRIMCGVKINTF